MICTRTGDDGTTSLAGGTRVSKDDLRIDANGEIDQLVSILGFVSVLLKHDNYSSEIYVIQNRLFQIESMIAAETEEAKQNTPEIQDIDIAYLERKIDTMNMDLPTLKGFVVPTSSRTATLLHIARTQARKCERRVVACDKVFPQNKVIIRYLNRLSDYLFVLSRTIMYQKHRPEKLFKHTIENE